MNVDELLALDRPLTREEEAFLEQELLKLARELESKVATIAAQIGPEYQDLVERLRGAAGRTVENIEAAIAVDANIDNMVGWLKQIDPASLGADPLIRSSMRSNEDPN